MAEFIPGRELARLFYWGAVRPLLDRIFPGLPHAAGHLGTGSDVLGFDTEMSRRPRLGSFWRPPFARRGRRAM